MNRLYKHEDVVQMLVDVIEQIEENEGIEIVDRPMGWESVRDYAEEVVSDVPSAENKGEWKHLKGDEWLCSNCGYVVWTEGSWEHPLERGKDYCEHCGAHMKGASR